MMRSQCPTPGGGGGGAGGRGKAAPEAAVKVDLFVQFVSAQATEGEAGQVADKDAGQPVQAHCFLRSHGRSFVLQLVVCTSQEHA